LPTFLEQNVSRRNLLVAGVAGLITAKLGAPVANLLALWRDDTRTSAEVKSLALNRIGDINRKVQELNSLKQALINLTERCHGDERPDCPIIEELARP
jgi:hypothetical protein